MALHVVHMAIRLAKKLLQDLLNCALIADVRMHFERHGYQFG